MSLYKLALEWLEKAKRDLDGAKVLRKARYYDLASYHCQQAAEKSVKGFLVLHDVTFSKNHNIKEHLDKAEKIETSFSLLQEAGSYLTPFAVLSRYPNESVKVSAKTCATAYKYATKIYEHTLSLMPKQSKK